MMDMDIVDAFIDSFVNGHGRGNLIQISSVDMDYDGGDDIQEPDPQIQQNNEFSEDEPCHLLILPQELQNRIFCYLPKPRQFSLTCKHFSNLSKDSQIRADWLLSRYGKNAVEACGSWNRLVDSSAFEYLIKKVSPLPRYVIQRLQRRFALKNRPDLVISVLQSGVSLYDDLSLDTPDTTTFRDICIRAGNTVASFFNFNFHLGGDERDQLSEEQLETVTELVEKYRFSLNYAKCNPNSALSNVNINEGYKHFLQVVSHKNVNIGKVMIKLGVATHIQPSFSRQTARNSVEFSHTSVGTDDEWAPTWIASVFPSDLRQYLTPSCDAIVWCTKLKVTELVRELLLVDINRWTTPHGKKVLKNLLQLAVDINYTEGVNMIKGYLVIDEETEMSKSASALRKLFNEALRDCRFQEVQDLIYEGAYFHSVHSQETSLFTSNLNRAIEQNRFGILLFLLRNYTFSHSQYEKMVSYATENRRSTIAVLIIEFYDMLVRNEVVVKRHHKFSPPILPLQLVSVKLLRRACASGMTLVFDAILKSFFKNSKKMVGGLLPILRLVDKRKADYRSFDDKEINSLLGYIQLCRNAQTGKPNRHELNVYEWADRKFDIGPIDLKYLPTPPEIPPAQSSRASSSSIQTNSRKRKGSSNANNGSDDDYNYDDGDAAFSSNVKIPKVGTKRVLRKRKAKKVEMKEVDSEELENDLESSSGSSTREQRKRKGKMRAKD